MPRQVEIVLEDCIGCQACVDLCPLVFQMDSTGDHALVMRSDLTGQEECVQQAIDDCPVHCMHWLE
ncbi:MAG: ferredoxin [Desulfarculus sp.]|nr:ferredoxin [Desulfarculus sp.]